MAAAAGPTVGLPEDWIQGLLAWSALAPPFPPGPSVILAIFAQCPGGALVVPFELLWKQIRIRRILVLFFRKYFEALRLYR